MIITETQTGSGVQELLTENIKLAEFTVELRKKYLLNNRVLFIQSLQFLFESLNIEVIKNRGYYAYPPAGLQHLTKALSARNLEIRILDLNYQFLKRVICNDAFNYHNWLDILDDCLNEYRPFIVGVTAISVYTDVFKPAFPLTSILKRLRDRDDCIVVAGGPTATNETENYLKDLRIKNLSVIRENKIGCTTSRNKGIKKATGDIIALIDDDCHVDRDWLNRIYNYFNANNYLVGAGHIYDLGLKKILNPHNSTEIEKNFLEGNISFRREIFDYAEFNENILYGAEGYDLISRIDALWPNFPYFIDQIPITHFRAPSQYRDKNIFELNDLGRQTEARAYRLWYINKHIFRRNLNTDSSIFKLSYWLKEAAFLPLELSFVFNLNLLIKTKLFIYKQLLKIKMAS